MQGTYYDILGIGHQAKPDEVKRAYRTRAKSYHPDLNPAPGAAEQFMKATEAYEILSDPQKRAAYDLRLKAPQQTTPAQDRAQQREAAYRQWVNEAQRRAQGYARMNYEQFHRSKFEVAEARVFMYMQFLVVGMVMLLATFFFTLPLMGMFYINWKAIFLAAPLVPMSLMIYRQGMRMFKELRRYL